MGIDRNSTLFSSLPTASLPAEPVIVSLDVVWAGSTAKHDARISEISMSGCFIDSNGRGRKLGDIVEFNVRLPDGPWVSLQGELIDEDYPMGFELRFMNLTEADKRALAEVVRAHGGISGLDTSNADVWQDRKDPDQFKNQLTIETKSALVAKGSSFTDPRPFVLTRGRVLIADDDPLTLRMVSAIVRSEGYEAVAVADGRKALRILQRDGDFCAAIFDMFMPHILGLDLILYMKADEKLRRIPVGMITTEQDPKVWKNSVAAGALVFLPKPFAPPQVAMMLRMLANKVL